MQAFREFFYNVSENVDGCNHHGKQYLRFLKKLKIELPYDSASPLLGFKPNELKLDSPRDIFFAVFVAAVFTITDTGKQPKCPLMYQWIDI